MTFYRKYRPQIIEEIDNEEIRKKLSAVLSSKSLPNRQASFPHAFLFSGTKGTGKTSSARIIAKAINCQNRKPVFAEAAAGRHLTDNIKQKEQDIEPCNKCGICEAITSGTSMDVLEIDGASNRGIDEIRYLREKIKLMPSICKYKVYIIDEAHMLTTEAFNALLKTLEEPPEHAVFILATTEPRKLPETIISRCLRFDFKRAKIDELIRSLSRIVLGENINIDSEALKEISRNSDGSFREAAKALEQLSFENKKIDKEQVKIFFGQIKLNRADELLEHLAEKDLSGAVSWIDQSGKAGADFKVITLDLLEILHAFLLKKAAGLENEEINFGKSYEKLSLDDIKRLIELFSKAYLDLKFSVVPDLPLEVAVLDWSGKKETEVPDKNPTYVPEEKQRAPVKNLPKVIRDIKYEEVLGRWQEVLEGIKPLNHSVHAVLKSARPLNIEGNVLVIEAFYKFHKERLEEPKVNTLLSSVICDKLGCQLGVKCVLGEKVVKVKQEPEEIKKEEVDKKPDVGKDNEDEELLKATEEIFK